MFKNLVYLNEEIVMELHNIIRVNVLYITPQICLLVGTIYNLYLNPTIKTSVKDYLLLQVGKKKHIL